MARESTLEDKIRGMSKKLRPYDAEKWLFNLVAEATGAFRECRLPSEEEMDQYDLREEMIPCLLRYGRTGEGQGLPLQIDTCLSAIKAFHDAGLSFEQTGCLGDKIYALRKLYLKVWLADQQLYLWCPPDEQQTLELVTFGLSHCPRLNVFQATSALARYLFHAELRCLPPAEAVAEIVQWAEANVPMQRGRRQAIESQCKAIWNDLLEPEPPTAEIVDLVKSVFPLEDVRGRWSPNRAVKIRIGCLRLLCLALAQARSWRDERVEIPSSWFAARQDPDDPGSILGVCLTNRHRCMLEPLEEARVLIEISKGNKLRHNATVYRLSLDPGEEVLTLEQAESLLTF